METRDDPAVIDLVRVGDACRRVVDWYDEFRSMGTGSLGDLDLALRMLGALPHMGGRVGRAIALITQGGGPSPTATVAAIEQLRVAASTCQPQATPPRPLATSTRNSGRYDVPLPRPGTTERVR